MHNKQSGQIAIVILLIMVVLLTIGLSLASRTTQELFLSQQESESTRVFNAAESGIENALSQDFSSITAQTSLADLGIADTSTNTVITPQTSLETQLTQGSTAHVDLTGKLGGDQITINWSKKDNCDDSASLLVSTYYDTNKVIHETIAPSGTCAPPRDTDGFVVGTTPGNDGYTYKQVVTLSSTLGTPLFMRIKAIYKDTPLKVAGTIANQSFVIRSQADNDLGSETRTIEVSRGISSAPSFMDYAVYSGGSLAQ